MKLHRYKSLSLLAILILATSCSPLLYEMAVDIREPAAFPVNLEEKSVAIYIASSEQGSYSDSLLKVNFASGIASGLESKLGLSEEAVYIYNHYPSEDSVVTMEYIQSLSRQADSDIVILIDRVSVSDFSRVENLAMGSNRDIQYMYASFSSKISIYDGVTATIVAKVDQKDTVYWELLTKSDLNITSSKEGVEKVINMVAPRVGRDIAARFFPSWVTEHRHLFVFSGDPLWERAYSNALAFDWDKAIGAWLRETDNTNKYRAACAAINIAVGCEMTGRPELALEWLVSAEMMYNRHKLGLNDYKLRLKREIEKREKE